jgi:hypothetical protein
MQQWHGAKETSSGELGPKKNCEPRSKLTAAEIKVTHHARVTWPRKKFVRKDCTRNQRKQETSKRRNYEKRRFTGPKCKNGIRNGVLKQQLSTDTGIKDPGARQQLRPRNEKMLYEIFTGRIARQIVGNPSRLQRMKKWILWREQPPPKRKKSCVRSKSRANVGAPATPGVTAHIVVCVREREIKKKILDDCDNCTDCKLTKETARDELVLRRELM